MSPRLDDEIWLANRLANYGHIFEGVTDHELRRKRMREAIREGALEDVPVGKRNGKITTYAQAFEGLWGEKL